VIISIINQKGGVGKTTTTINLGAALAKNGKKVLLIDMDPQGNLTTSLFKNEFEKTIYHVFLKEVNMSDISVKHDDIKIVPADIELSAFEMQSNINNFYVLSKELKLIHDYYDYILIDCPPSLNLFTINAMIASNYLIIPVTTELMSIKGLNQLIKSYNEIKETNNGQLKVMGILFTKYDKRQTIDNEILKIDTPGIDKFETIIRRSVELKEVPGSLKSIFEFAPNSRGAKDYMNLALEVMKYE